MVGFISGVDDAGAVAFEVATVVLGVVVLNFSTEYH